MHKKYGYVLASLAVSLILVLSVLNTTWLSELALGKLLTARQGIHLKRIHIERQKFSLPGRLEWQKVDLALEANGKLLTVQAPQVVVTGLQTVWSDDRRMRVTTQGLTARYAPGQIKDIKTDLTVDRDGISGPLTAVDVYWDRLRAKDLSAFLIVNAQGIELRALKFAAYGGGITGKVLVQTVPVGLAGSYRAEFFADALDVALLSEVNPDIPDQLSGVVRGTLDLEGDPFALRMVDADLAMPLGGRMSASLLAALTQYLPQSREKKRLDLLVSKGEKIDMESFLFTMKGGKDGKFAGDIHLKSREVNLELNLTHAINTDGTIDSLLGYWQRLWQ